MPMFGNTNIDYRSPLRCHRDQAGAVGNPVGRLLRSALNRNRSESLKSKRMRKSSRLGTSLCHDPSLTLGRNVAKVVHKPDHDPPGHHPGLKQLFPLDVLLELASVHQDTAEIVE